MQSKRSRHLNHPLKHVGQRQVGDGHVLLLDLHRPLKETEQGEMKPVHHQTGNQRREIPLQQGQSKSQLIIPLDTAGGGGSWETQADGELGSGKLFSIRQRGGSVDRPPGA